ncbi:hypothetical protein [Sinanaerobacter chloroacetimidivorans]|uniref:Uncharacterized protein n=1 Tax=Sinanaerobacter chloroacetimidivorans TaxID=2818044 RepID=A0A8J7VYE2_9FIRM|nr:hypothetical protein [Sinanaerobacter chloroacetimidivorans]MBR0596961.1 hypothetical protein [Sinanaerobacter chloroacetimidivorans]
MAKLTSIQLEKLMGPRPESFIKVPFRLGEEEVILKVKSYLTIQEISDIVDGTVEGCFSEQGYAPEYRNLVFAWKVIDVMTDLPLPVTKDKQIDFLILYEWSVRMDLISGIMGADETLYSTIKNLQSYIDEKLEYRKQLSLRSSKSEELSERIFLLFGKAAETIDQITAKIRELDPQELEALIRQAAISMK